MKMKLTIDIINLNDEGALYLDCSPKTDDYPDLKKGELSRLYLTIIDIVNQISVDSEKDVNAKKTLKNYNGDKIADLVFNWTVFKD